MDLEHTCTNIVVMITGLGWQASKHKPRLKKPINDTESVQPECQVIGQKQCTGDDETDQHVHRIACHGALLILFPRHVATDNWKDQHAHKTCCERETSHTFLLVKN